MYDKNLARLRPKTMAFQNYGGTDTMSVILAAARNHDAASAISGKHADYFLVEFSVGFARELSQGVVPFDDTDEPGHHHVVGKKTGSVRDRFAKECSWAIAPPSGFQESAAVSPNLTP